MSRERRYRNKSEPYPKGSIYWNFMGSNPGIHDNTGLNRITTDCWDSVGQPCTSSPLELNRTDLSGLNPLTGDFDDGNGTFVQCDGYLPGNYRTNRLGHRPISTKSPDQYAWELAAATNPSRPEIVPLSIIKDMVDLPQMLKNIWDIRRDHWRRGVAKGLSNAYLETVFGWLPIVQDAKQVFNMGNYVRSRVIELNNMYNTGGKNVRKRLGRFVDTGDSYAFISSGFPINLEARYYTSTTVQVWGTAKWKLDRKPGEHRDPRQVFYEALAVCSGMTSEGLAQGLWDLVPWSFIVDWFGGIGDMINSWSNTIPAHIVETCIMASRETKHEWTPTVKPNWASGGDGHAKSETKQRWVYGSFGPTLYEPIVSSRRLSILGALSIQRYKKPLF